MFIQRVPKAAVDFSRRNRGVLIVSLTTLAAIGLVYSFFRRD